MAEDYEQNGTAAGAATRLVKSVADSPYHFVVYFFVTVIMVSALYLALRTTEEAHATLRQCLSQTIIPRNEPP